MVTAQLNYFDIVVLSIMALSCLFALFRGFVKEILSLAAWVGSAFIALRFYGPFSETLKPHFAEPKAGAIAAGVVLYVGSLICFAIFNRCILKVLKSGSGMGVFDNILGFLFGGVRGAFIVSLAYLMITLVISEDNRPDWLEKAVTRPYVEQGSLLLTKIAPTYTEDLSNMQKNAKANMQESIKSHVDGTLQEKMNQIQEQNGEVQQGAPIEFKDAPEKKDKDANFNNLIDSLKKFKQ